jgi:transaldolase
VTGLTSNPTIFDKAIRDGTAYDADIAARKASGASDEEVLFELALADLRRAAGLFAPVHARTDTAVAGRVPGELRDRLGIAVARQAYRAYRALLDSPRWLRLANEGARAQRLLWASTSVKDPAAPDVLYVDALAAPFTVDTMPDHTLEAFADHGIVGDLLPADGGDADQVIAAFAQAGIDVAALAGELQRQGAEAFMASWQDLLARIGARHEQLSR